MPTRNEEPQLCAHRGRPHTEDHTPCVPLTLDAQGRRADPRLPRLWEEADGDGLPAAVGFHGGGDRRAPDLDGGDCFTV